MNTIYHTIRGNRPSSAAAALRKPRHTQQGRWTSACVGGCYEMEGVCCVTWVCQMPFGGGAAGATTNTDSLIRLMQRVSSGHTLIPKYTTFTAKKLPEIQFVFLVGEHMTVSFLCLVRRSIYWRVIHHIPAFPTRRQLLNKQAAHREVTKYTGYNILGCHVEETCTPSVKPEHL